MTTLRNAWLTPAPVQTCRYVMTPQGRGHIWDGVPLNVQIRRDRIAVCFDDGKPAVYFSQDELEFEEKS